MPNTRSTIPTLSRQFQANDLIERGPSFRMRCSDLLLAGAVMVVAVEVFVFRAWIWDTDTQPCWARVLRFCSAWRYMIDYHWILERKSSSSISKKKKKKSNKKRKREQKYILVKCLPKPKDVSPQRKHEILTIAHKRPCAVKGSSPDPYLIPVRIWVQSRGGRLWLLGRGEAATGGETAFWST